MDLLIAVLTLLAAVLAVKHHEESIGAGVGGFHLYRECFDEENAYVYLEFSGVPFEGPALLPSLQG